MKLSINFEFSLFNKKPKIICVKSFTESMFPISLWRDLKAGDFVVYRRSKRIRKIKEAKNGFVVFENTVYCSGDRYMFMPLIEE